MNDYLRGILNTAQLVNDNKELNQVKSRTTISNEVDFLIAQLSAFLGHIWFIDLISPSNYVVLEFCRIWYFIEWTLGHFLLFLDCHIWLQYLNNSSWCTSDSPGKLSACMKGVVSDSRIRLVMHSSAPRTYVCYSSSPRTYMSAIPQYSVISMHISL